MAAAQARANAGMYSYPPTFVMLGLDPSIHAALLLVVRLHGPSHQVRG